MRIDERSRQLVEARLDEMYIQHRTWAGVAKHLQVSTAYLNDVIHHRREPGEAILKPLGLHRVVFYQRLDDCP